MIGRLLIAIIDVIIGFAELMLGLRFALRLLDASQAAPFVSWLYATSQSLLDPFRGIFPNSVVSPGHVLEFSTLFAIVIYAVVGYLIAELIGWISHTAHPAPTEHAA